MSTALRLRISQLKGANLKLSELAKISDVSYTTLMSFINGENKTTTLNTIYNLCNGLDIGLFDFFNSNLFVDVFDEEEKNLKFKNKSKESKV